MIRLIYYPTPSMIISEQLYIKGIMYIVEHHISTGVCRTLRYVAPPQEVRRDIPYTICIARLGI